MREPVWGEKTPIVPMVMAGGVLALRDHIEKLITKCGGLRKMARAYEIDPDYLSCLRDGSKTRPSEKVLRRLGLRRIDYYQEVGK